MSGTSCRSSLTLGSIRWHGSPGQMLGVHSVSSPDLGGSNPAVSMHNSACPVPVLAVHGPKREVDRAGRAAGHCTTQIPGTKEKRRLIE